MEKQQVVLPDQSKTVIKWFGDRNPALGTVIFLPALGASIDYYLLFARTWAKSGFRIALVEMRGQRNSSVQDVKKHNFGYKEILDIDLATIIPEIIKNSGGPVWLCGHSLGGQFALLHACRNSTGLSGIILLAAGSNHYGSLVRWRDRTRRLTSVIFMQTVNLLLGFFPGDKLGFGGRQPKNMIGDWAHEAIFGTYKISGSGDDYDKMLNSIEIPVFMISFEGDWLVPPSGAEALQRKLACAKVNRITISLNDFSNAHFSWIKSPELIIPGITKWMENIQKNK